MVSPRSHGSIARERRVNRYYDPNSEQFVSVDPEVMATGQPYVFVGGDPVNFSDPKGDLVCETGGTCATPQYFASNPSASSGGPKATPESNFLDFLSSQPQSVINYFELLNFLRMVPQLPAPNPATTEVPSNVMAYNSYQELRSVAITAAQSGNSQWYKALSCVVQGFVPGGNGSGSAGALLVDAGSTASSVGGVAFLSGTATEGAIGVATASTGVGLGIVGGFLIGFGIYELVKGC